MSKAVLYGPKQNRSKILVNIRTEHNIIHADNAMDHFRGEEDAAALQRIMLNKQQLVTRAHDFISKLSYNRYSFCKHIERDFLWSKFSALKIQLDI